MTAVRDGEWILARLVGFDTDSAKGNLPVADFLCGLLEGPGVRIDRNSSADGRKVNLVVRKGPDTGPDRGGLVLSAHVDTVPAGEGWTSDPFVLTDRGDRWVGRGTADMKGFLALAVEAFLRADPGRLAAPLALVLTYDEELGLLGARRLVETWPAEDPLPRNCVVGEPTSLRVVRMHKGHLQCRVTVHGVSAHSGYPHRGANAIEPAARVVAALAALREDLARERPPGGEHYPDTPFVTLNVGRISGGMAVNVVPDRCTVELGLRPLPGMDAEPLARRVREAVERGTAGSRFDFETTNDAPPMCTGADAPIHRALCVMTGQRDTAAVSYGTDGAWLQRLGMDCVVFGPGSIEVAHKPDEFLPKEDFVRGRAHLERLIARFCSGEARP
ncbi:MAG: acetylornithine deacetylase [Acidobacteria bacterium]|nr:acetylornithine deacetylase [Acidobacteriota bacterium]